MPTPVCTGPQGNTCTPNQFRLEIFPGEKGSGRFQAYGSLSAEIWDGRLVVYENNQPLSPAYQIFAGPRHTVRPPGAHPAHPTVPGPYVLDAPEAHVSGSWPDAEIPTGAFLRREGNIIHTEFTAKGVHRHVVVNNTVWYEGALARELQKNSNRPYPLPQAQVEQDLVGRIMSRYTSTWEGDPAYANDPAHMQTAKFAYNPFGPWSFRLNAPNGRQGKQHLHTTPNSFLAYLRPDLMPTTDRYLLLGSSHGCVHISWNDLKVLIAKGYAKRGVCVVIHPYGRTGPAGIKWQGES